MKRQKWTGLCIICLFIMQFCIFMQLINANFITSLQNSRIDSQSVGHEFVTYAHYTNTGDFVNWQMRPDLGGNWTDFSDVGNELYLKIDEYDDSVRQCYITRDVGNISTAEIRNYAFYINLTTSHPYLGSYSNGGFKIRAYFTDGTYLQIGYYLFSENPPTPPGYTKKITQWYNGTFTAGKTLDYIWLEGTATYTLTIIRIYDELYKGYTPTVTEWQNYTGTLDIREMHYFYVQSSNSADAFLQLQYIETGNTHSVTMLEDWTYDDFYYTNYTFFREGYYNIRYSVRNSWNIYTLTPQFTVLIIETIFPLISYLNVRSHEYRDVPEELFYVYLGASESVTIFDFRALYGNWQHLGNVAWAFGYERIAFNCSPGGIKSDFSHIAPGRQYYLQNLTLEFDLCTNRDRLVIILNPTSYDYDYLLNISEAYQDEWVKVRIPIYMFQCFPSASNTIGELGFYSNWGYYEIANIKLCTYHFSTMLINYTTQTYSTTEIQTIGNSSLYYYNLEDNSTQNSLTMWNNQTNWLNNTYNLQCAIMETNQTSYINQTFNATPEYDAGHYAGLYSFKEDTDGADPTDWTNGKEDSGTSHNVYAEKESHKKVVEFWDNNAGGYAYIYNTFTAQTNGTIELWLFYTLGTGAKWFFCSIRDGANVRMGFYFELEYGRIRKNDFSGEILASGLSENYWHHIRIDFDCNSDTYDLFVNSSLCATDKAFDSVSTTVSSLHMNTGSSWSYGNLYVYIDAVDYSWASDYYLNRNLDFDVIQYDLNQTVYFNYSSIEKSNIYNIELSTNNTNFSYELYNYTANAFESFYSNYTVTYTESGDFEAWETVSGSFETFNDTENELLLQKDSYGVATAKRDFEFNAIINTIMLNVKIDDLIVGFTEPFLLIELYFNDASKQGIYSEAFSVNGSDSGWINESIDLYAHAGKQPAYLLVTFFVDTDCEINLTLYDEIYIINSLTDIPLDYFNETTIMFHFNSTSLTYFTFNLSISIQINYFYYENASYSYYYDLSVATMHYFYNFTLNYSQEINTTVMFQWRTSIDNSTWSAWSNDLLIEDFKPQYLQYRIDCNTTYLYNTSHFDFANLFYSLFNISYYFLQVDLNTTILWHQYFINTSIILDITTSFNLINSSIEIYNFSALIYENISAVQDLNQLLTLNQNSSAGLILVNISIFSSTSFSLFFNESYIKAYNSQFIKYCYVNISSDITLTEFEELSFWYNFSDSRAFLQLQLYNSSWYSITQLTKTLLNYGLANASATTRFYQYWQNITLDNNYTRIRLYFVLTYPINENETVELQAKRFECINLSNYRLESEINRQRYDILIFEQQIETLLIVDFAGREIYRQDVSYSQFIDIYINIAEVTLVNYLNVTAWVAFESRGVTVTYGVAAESQRNVIILLDDYWIQISTDNLTILDVRQVSITSTNKTTIQIGDKPADITIPPQSGLLELLWQAIVMIFTWFFTNTWGIVIFVIFMILLAINLYRKYKKRKDREIEIYKQGYADGLAAAQAIKLPEEHYPEYFHFRGD